MPNEPTPTGLRERLTQAGWNLTELGGGPWIVFGFNGNTELCVMGKTRKEAWQKALDTAKTLRLLSVPANHQSST